MVEIGVDTIAIPPGETIKEMLEDRQMSQKEFAARMNYTEKHISKLIHGEAALSQETALRLEIVLGAPASFWNGLEADYREDLQRVKQEKLAEEEAACAEKYPYERMAEAGWVEQTQDRHKKIDALRKFFEVVRLKDIPRFFPDVSSKDPENAGERYYERLAEEQESRRNTRFGNLQPAQ